MRRTGLLSRRWHCQGGDPCLFWSLLVCLLRPASALCESPADLGKVVVVSASVEPSNGGETIADLLCGDDPAAAVARAVTSRRGHTEDAEAALALARLLQERLDANAVLDYSLPSTITTDEQVERSLRTAGLHSRRAAAHFRKEEHAWGIADLLRALVRPGLDPTAQDKLMSTLEDVLQKVGKKLAETAMSGDLMELLDVLEVPVDDSDANLLDVKMLKRQYRDLSMKYHPDKDPRAAARFNAIRDAYEILSDEVKTLLYDTGGMDLVKKYEGGGENIQQTEREERVATVTLADLYMGTKRSVKMRRRVVCRACRLHRHTPRCRRCESCPPNIEKRQRWINPRQYIMEDVRVDSKEKCTHVVEDVPVVIERGMMAGDTIRQPHLASQLPEQIPGDLYVQLRGGEDKWFKRIGNDLQITLGISLYDALLGFRRTITHLDGHSVRFHVKPGTVLKPGFGLKIADEGMPLREDPSSFGSLVVKFNVTFPDEVPPGVQGALDEVLRSMKSLPGAEDVNAGSARTKRARAEL